MWDGVRRVRRWAFGLLVVATTACSYVFDLPDDPAVALTAADANADVRLSDAETREAQAPFCPTHPGLFCLDFDREPLPAFGAGLGLASTVSLSPPRSLVASTGSYAEPLAPAPNGLAMSFSVLVSSWGAEAAELGGLDLDGCTVSVTGEGQLWGLAQTCGETRVVSATSTAFARQRWQRFTIEVRPAEKRVTMAVDGVRVVDVAALDGITGATAGLRLGVRSGSVVVFQDDVLVTSL